jgi:DNA topoisomerase IA
MATLIITEKASQAKDLLAAFGARFGQILPAEGHLLRLAEPEEVNAAWKSWSCVVLKPDGLYPTRPAAGGNKPVKLKAIAAALKTCDDVILATDCDREGQLIGQEILDHLGYRGRVRRALFTAQDPKTLCQAFARLKPNVEMRPLYEAAVARQQADQIFNLSLTRTATKTSRRRPMLTRMARQQPRRPQFMRIAKLMRFTTRKRDQPAFGFVGNPALPAELCGILGDGVNQAADFFSDTTSIPSRNVTLLTTFGN